MIQRIFHWLFVTFLFLSGLYSVLLGGWLVYLGGSAYYLLSGLAVLYIVYAIYRGNPRAAIVYGGLLATTLVWAWYESDMAFLSLLPRVAMWLVLGLWFLSPWYRSHLASKSSTSEPASSRWIVIPSVASVLVLAFTAFSGHTVYGSGTVRTEQPTSATSDWRHYGNTLGGTRFAEIDQINVDNVAQLEEAWRYRTGVEDDFKMTPLQVNGLVYLCGARNILIAIDDATGKEVWRHDPQVAVPDKHQYARTCRGVSYHEVPASAEGSIEDASSQPMQCSKRIVTGTVDARLLAVDALTGQPCTDFGNQGSVDLRKGMGPHLPKQYYITSPPLVADDLLVVGGLVLDSQDLGLPSGVVRAYHAVTGEFVWAWDAGRPGYHGEPAEGEMYTRGTPNVWSVMSYDPELELIYAPTGNASPDYFGGYRRQVDDEWSSAVVALDANTGSPSWKYQTVHHDIWDYDVPAQPVLVDVTREDERIPSVAVPTKTGDIFLLDRRDGTPVHPIEEKPVPQEPALGEYVSATQPFTSTPHFHPYRYEKDMWGLTPLDQLACRVEYKMMRYEGLFTPPTPSGSFQFPANFGGFNWGSVSVDADNGLLIAAPMLLGNRTMLVTPEQVAEAGPRAALLLGSDHPAVRMDPDAPMPEKRDPDPDDPFDHANITYYGLTLPFMSRWPTQVPCFEPPWSTLSVIDLNTNERLWSRPIGSMKNSGPFGWRTGLPFQVGTPVRAGTMTTRGGLTFISSTMDSSVRAFDVRSGAVKWHADLPGSGQATPMSYVSEKSGKQYVIVTIPNPSWRYPRDPATGTYTDSKSVKDGKGGYVIAYALED
ncbi:MAG: PQQ-binding-like beta-propeller repeat protein [Pseudomonadota bacterium]